MDFIKMHVAGSDYIIIDCLDCDKNTFLKLKEKVKKLSDRHIGIGGNGLILIVSSVVADAKMIMFNSDGSESTICGDGLLCLAKYLYDNKALKKKEIDIETPVGIKKTILKINHNQVESILVNMGEPNLSSRSIPIMTDKSIFINEPINILNKKYAITCLSIGNPHAVTFVKNVDLINLKELGLSFELYYQFPERINAEFVEIIDSKTIKVRYWGRGVGETFSCGSGACASVVAAIINHKLLRNEKIKVISKEGELQVTYKNDNHILMEGIAEEIFEGKILKL